MTILEKIVDKKRERVNQAKKRLPLETIREMALEVRKSTKSKRFSSAIRRVSDSSIRIIAEIKRASPTKGLLRDFKTEELAQAYIRGGADALSVITEEDFFLGSPEAVGVIRNLFPDVPILRKDFIFDPYQIYETKLIGADALLLIAAILDERTSKELFELAVTLELEVLFEVHTEEELKRALKLDFPIIGINNRNLRTMEISIENTIRLRQMIPDSKIVVSESGIGNPSQVQRLISIGVDAILVGTSLVLSNDPTQLLLELKGGVSKRA